MTNVLNNKAVLEYKKIAIDMLRLSFPQLTVSELEYAVDLSIQENVKDHPVQVNNSYKKTVVDTTILELADYIMSKEPILTAAGVMFTKHTDTPNPIYKMINGFIVGRSKMKSIMFQYPKGSQDFSKYNLAQLLLKLDANAYYGASGMYSCIYYNLHAAISTTYQSRSVLSAAALLIESFLANNVPFACLNEAVTFIHQVIKEDKIFNDYDWISHNPSVEETFFKIVSSCGFAWIPTEEEMIIIWDILSRLDQWELNRLYYKNNLFEFCNNPKVMGFILSMLQKLEAPFVDSNKIPSEIADDMTVFKELIFEYVYHHHQIIDRLDKMDVLIRDVSIIQDTDSCIASFDGWYRYILNNTYNIPMRIKEIEYDPIDETISGETWVPEYDFLNDEVIDQVRVINPIVIIPHDGLRYSIISIMANALGDCINDFMYRYCCNSNSHLPQDADLPNKNAKCMMFMKNEFLMKRALLTDAKKHYAAKLELQEGNVVPEEESLDVKGMEAFAKSTISDDTKTKLKKILYEDILNTPMIDQALVLRKIAIVENDIYKSIQNGEKLYYKPVKIRSASGYSDPMRIQGIKASIAYNELHEPDTEAIDLTIRNSVDIVKVEINKKNIGIIEEDFPGVYHRAITLMANNKYYAAGIDAIAIPLNEIVPAWVLPFVRYAEIINDNVAKFPLESIGLNRGNDHNNSTNILYI